ncbi:hypothetical protein AB6A40_002074 [Gnathostoma spinigerum]|uniref:non-specific serine/threonine protein kinase n=1 Tax=Gnathostoma spinigerum TaxID=75299 RepID=A0ABD6E5N6_9BILA
MGNVLSAPIPSQILPVEAYLSEIPEMEFVQSLGSTRFMKVARANHAEGAILVKVFLIQDPSFSIEPYRDQILQIRDLLASAYNCCPFKKVIVTSRFAILSRSFQKNTLYERLSTRPFLTSIEKKWIAFQLFKAAAQCEAADVCHGDLKTQNILVSSSSWVQITDFASYKPAVIPSDDPSHFTFFFDTSRRLSCYLAPERFKPSQELNSTLARLPGEFFNVSEGLTHAMDIFSLGCVLVELFTDGWRPFTYEKMISYRNASETVAEQMLGNILEQLPKELRELIRLMLNVDPSKRPTSREILKTYAPRLVPPVFDHFLFNYLSIFRPKPSQTSISLEEPSQAMISIEPDDVIAKLADDLDEILSKFREEIVTDGKKSSQKVASILVISLITSNVRSLKSLGGKLASMKMLQKLAELSDTSVICDRILPYMIHLLSDGLVQVRSEAINEITRMLESLKEIPRNETRLFIDYLFPRLKVLSVDSSTLVKMSLAHNLGTLAEASVRFLHQGSRDLLENLLEGSIYIDEKNTEDTEERLTRQEMNALYETVKEIFDNLCVSDNNVKHCLTTRDSLEKLCQFFNRQKTSDELLRHITTHLNDKSDWRLRAAFFQCCPTIAKFLSFNQIASLKPLLEQGLHDFEEFVQLQDICCICELCRLKFFERTALFELLREVLPFLSHPNEWLRMAVVNLLSVLDEKLTVADVHCKLLPMVSPYLTEPLIKLNNKFVVASCLKPPIPQSIWTYVIDHCPIASLLDYLNEKQILIGLDGGYSSVFASSRKKISSQQPLGRQLEAILLRLENLGMTNEVELKFIRFTKILTAMERFRSSRSPSNSEQVDGAVDLRSLPHVKLSKFDLKTRLIRSASVKALNPPVKNIEWTATFADDSPMNSQQYRPSLFTTSNYSSEDASSDRCTNSVQQLSTLASFGTVRSSDCDVMLSELLSQKHHHYLRRQCQHSSLFPKFEVSSSNASLPSLRHRTRLIAHLHEHTGAIRRLALNPVGTCFASASSDGMVKLWSVGRLQNDMSAVMRSDATYTHRHPINSVQFLGVTGERMAIASESCRIPFIDVDRLCLLSTLELDKEKNGPPFELIAVDNMLYVLSHHNYVLCYDCRVPTNGAMGRCSYPIREYRIDDFYALITSFCVDPHSQNWMCLTSTSCHVILWDLRFGIEVKSWNHPRCRMLRCWPAWCGTNGICNEVWTSSSSCGELTCWKLETAQKSHVLWPASTKRPFNYDEDKFVTTAMARCDQTGRIYTGDSFGALRCWGYYHNSPNLSDCHYLSGPKKSTLTEIEKRSFSSITYNSETVEGVEVIYETENIFRENTCLPKNIGPIDLEVCRKQFIWRNSRNLSALRTKISLSSFPSS